MPTSHMYLYLLQNRGHIQMRTTSHAFQIHDHVGVKEKVMRSLLYTGAIKDMSLCCATTSHTARWRSNLNAIRGHMNLNYSTVRGRNILFSQLTTLCFISAFSAPATTKGRVWLLSHYSPSKSPLRASLGLLCQRWTHSLMVSCCTKSIRMQCS